MLLLSAYVVEQASYFAPQTNFSSQAGGNSGKYMAESLLKTGKHTVTALARDGSNASLPEGVHVKTIDYDNLASIVDALQGQQALVITMNPMAPKDTQEKLIRAAAQAKVQYILPNEWGFDSANVKLSNEALSSAAAKQETNALINEVGCSWIGVSTGFWYEWSLAIPASYGFDIEKRTVTFIDDGETKITTSTWPQVGRAVAGLLSLKVSPDGPDDKISTLESFKNKYVYTGSFTISQKDMLESLQRVTKTTGDDWTITKEPHEERYAAGLAAMKTGDRMGFAKAMYTRVFYPDDGGNTEKTRGLANGALGLPKEDLDEATKAAVKRSEEFKLGY
jgi:hypothetical protein